MTITIGSNDRILVRVQQFEGLGDLSCGMKVAEIIADFLKNNDQIVLVTDARSIDELNNRFNKRKFQIIDIADISKIQNVVLKVMAPANGWGPILSLACEHSGTPLVAFFEYNYSSSAPNLDRAPQISAYSLGLKNSYSPKELGILIDEDWQEKHEISKLSDRERIRLLPEEIKTHLKINDEIDRLFLVYASKKSGRIDRKEFIEKILKEHEGVKGQTDHRFVFIVPGLGENEKVPGVTEEDKSSVFPGTKEWCEKYENYLQGWGDQVRFFTERLSHEHFQKILTYSSSRCLITGDQSFSEAISSNKEFDYEYRPHKMVLSWWFKDIKEKHAPATNRFICENQDARNSLGPIIGSALQTQIQQPFDIEDLRNMELTEDSLISRVTQSSRICLLTPKQVENLGVNLYVSIRFIPVEGQPDIVFAVPYSS